MKHNKANDSGDNSGSLIIPKQKNNKSAKLIIILTVIFLAVGVLAGGIWFALQQTGPDYQEILAAGLRCYNKQYYDQAEDYYMEAKEISPKGAEPYQMLYQIYTVTDQPEKAQSIKSDAELSLETETWDAFVKQADAFDQEREIAMDPVNQLSGDLEEDDLDLILGDNYSLEDLRFVLSTCSDFDSPAVFTPEMLRDNVGRMLISLNFDLEDNPLEGEYEVKEPSFSSISIGRPVDVVDNLLSLYTDYICTDIPEEEGRQVACEDGFVYVEHCLEVNAAVVSIDQINKEGDTTTLKFTHTAWPNSSRKSREPKTISEKEAVLERQSDGSVRITKIVTLSSQETAAEQQTAEEETPSSTSSSIDPEILGEWVFDAEKTGKYISGSVASVFGNGARYGSGLTIDENGNFYYYVWNACAAKGTVGTDEFGYTILYTDTGEQQMLTKYYDEGYINLAITTKSHANIFWKRKSS